MHSQTAVELMGQLSNQTLVRQALDEMEPAEVDALFQASIVADLDEVPPEFLARVRERVQTKIDAQLPHDRWS